MGVGNLTTRAAGDTIVADFFNSIQSALDGAMVGRSSGAATSGQDLGTAAFPWGTARVTSLIVNGSVIDSALSSAPSNRVVSGAVRTTSSQPDYLRPTASLAFQVLGSATNLVINVNGTTGTVSTNITKTGITAGPSATHTCLVDDASAAAQAETRYWGEYEVRKELAVDTMGATMEAQVGKWIAFQIAGGATEYALGFLESSVKISRVRRGFFMNSSGSPINRTTLTNNDTITLLTLAWVFMDDDGTTVDVTYTNPVWAYSSPSSPVTGDYWYDLANSTWKRYDGASFQIIGRTFIGWACASATAVVGCRGINFYNRVNDLNTMDLEIQSTEIVRAREPHSQVAVDGTVLDFGNQLPTWNITTNLAATADMYSATEQASRFYYLYLGKTGQTFVSDIEPYYRLDLQGWYHPHNTWRALGICYNNGSSNITLVESYAKPDMHVRIEDGNGHGSGSTKIRRFSTIVVQRGLGMFLEQDSTLGDIFRCMVPGWYDTQFHDRYSGGASAFGLSLNSTALTTALSSVTNTERVSLTHAPAANTIGQANAQMYFKRGDILRPHTSGLMDGGADDVGMSVTRSTAKGAAA